LRLFPKAFGEDYHNIITGNIKHFQLPGWLSSGLILQPDLSVWRAVRILQAPYLVFNSLFNASSAFL